FPPDRAGLECGAAWPDRGDRERRGGPADRAGEPQDRRGRLREDAGRAAEGGRLVVAGGGVRREGPGRPGEFRAHRDLARGGGWRGGGWQAAASAKGGGGVPGQARRGAVEAECRRAAGGGADGISGGIADVQGADEDGAVNSSRCLTEGKARGYKRKETNQLR